MRSSFNAWEAENLICGQKYVVVMTILKHVTKRALQSWNLQSFHIIIKFLLVFESQILGYKPNPISWEKNLPNFCVKYWKNHLAYRWRNTVLHEVFLNFCKPRERCLLLLIVFKKMCNQNNYQIQFFYMISYIIRHCVFVICLSLWFWQIT